MGYYCPKTSGKKLIREYYEKAKHILSLPKEKLPLNYEFHLTLCEMAATSMVGQSFSNQNMYLDSCELLYLWTEVIFILMESKIYSNITDSFFLKSIDDFLNCIPSAMYIYAFHDILYKKVSKNNN